MANNAKKTEHSGAKHGEGSYWGYKAEAKRESNTARRRNDRVFEQEDPCVCHLGSVCGTACEMGRCHNGCGWEIQY